jgi:hypothetical protein
MLWSLKQFVESNKQSFLHVIGVCISLMGKGDLLVVLETHMLCILAKTEKRKKNCTTQGSNLEPPTP